MNCKIVKELIITDYTDNELDIEKRGMVKEHLTRCPACAAFEADIRKSAVEPFLGVKPVKPKEAVWQNIAGSIKESALPKRQFSSRPVFLAATLAVILIVAAVFLHSHYSEQKSLDLYIEEELGYLSSLGSNNAAADEDLWDPVPGQSYS